MATESAFTTILHSGRGIKKTEEAREWYRRQAGRVRRGQQRTRPNQLLLDAKARGTLRQRLRMPFMIGNMYMFRYNPKLRESLNYYDTLPLVFPIEQYEDGFLAINMHYLFPKYRAILMDKLYPLLRNNRMDETTRLRLTYELLNGTRKYKYFKPCLHRYLREQVESRYIQIPVEEWDIALFLPTDRFKKATRRKVWAQSRKDIFLGR